MKSKEDNKVAHIMECRVTTTYLENGNRRVEILKTGFPPKFVAFEEGGGFRLRNDILPNKEVYYKDAGDYWFNFTYTKDGLVVWCPNKKFPTHHLHNKKLIEISEAQWREDNQGYDYALDIEEEIEDESKNEIGF